MMSRHAVNIVILNRIYELINANPDLRLGQAMRILGVFELEPARTGLSTTLKDCFYEEPEVMLTRMNEVLKEIK
jgi:hypothetical protein